MKKIEMVKEYLDSSFLKQLDQNNEDIPLGFSAFDLSIDLKINRANLSKLLNTLWKENELIKINGRPILFIPFSLLSQHYSNIPFLTYYASYSDFKTTLETKVDDVETLEQNDFKLNFSQEHLSMVLNFPLIGYPALVLFEHGINKVEFVKEVYDYLIDRKEFSKNTHFIHIDCYLDYSKLIDLLEGDLYSSNVYSNSLIFINNIQALENDTIIKLDSFFTTLRDTYNKKSVKSKFVLGCNSKSNIKVPDSVSYTIKTLPFSQLSILDKLQYITNTFKNLSNKMNSNIRIQKDLFKAFCINEIDTDYFVIEKDISTALIKAHYRSSNENRLYTLLLWSDFSFPLIHKNIPKHTPLNIIDSYFDDVIQFNKDHTSKFDYIFNQPIIYELTNLILKTDFNSKETIDTFLDEFINRISSAKVYELQALIIHSGYSKFQQERIHGNEKEVGLDFLTTQLNSLQVEGFIPTHLEYLIETYNNDFQTKLSSTTALLLLIDSRHNLSTYSKLLENANFPNQIISIRNPLSIDELSNEINRFLPIKDIVIVTDINIYQNIDNLLQNVITQNVISYYPLSIPLIESLIDKLEKFTSIDQLHRERFTQPEKIGSSFDNDEDDAFVQNLTTRFLIPSLTFLDANKAVNELYPVLTKILNKLKISHSKEFVVKYLVHVTFLIERCIKKEYLEYPNLNRVLKENLSLFHIIQKEMLSIEEIFGITIPLSEIAYVVDIFKQN